MPLAWCHPGRKIEADKIELEMQEIELHTFLQEIYDLFKPKTDEASLLLELSIDSEIGKYVISDPVRLRQVISNLLSNAIKFTKSGKISLSVKLHTLKAQTGIKIDVSDTGIGLTKEQQSKIFKRFKQADSSTTRKFGGTGLGLAISKQLVELLKGNLTVQSKINSGSCFSFVIPCEFLSVSKNQNIEDNENASNFSSDIKILLVEDNPVNQLVAGGIFENLGLTNITITITISSNGKDAITTIEEEMDSNKEPFHLIFMDCQIPVMDGYQSTQILRAMNIKIPIIAMTANAMEGDREKCINSGMDDYLSKPIDIKILTNVVSKWLP